MDSKSKILILFMLGVFASGLTQNDGSHSETEFRNIDGEPAQTSMEYLRKVQTPITPKAVARYQIMAVEYDVAQSDLFDGRDQLFLVAFKTQKGVILTSYDRKGEVVESVEKFRDLALPLEIMRTGLRDYSGWRVVRTNYYVSYFKDRKPKIVYTIQISDGDKKKKILLDGDGLLLN